jgi:hypothetical protein
MGIAASQGGRMFNQLQIAIFLQFQLDKIAISFCSLKENSFL